MPKRPLKKAKSKGPRTPFERFVAAILAVPKAEADEAEAQRRDKSESRKAKA